MAIRRVTGAVSPSELVFADANALGSTYDGTGTTIERGETFTLPAGGTTAVSNGALRLEALKGDCTITNNGNSTLTNASGVNGTILMRSGASDFPAFVRNSSMGSMEVPARGDFTGDVTGTITAGTLGSSVVFPAGHVIQTVQQFWPQQFSQTFNVISSASGAHVVVNDGTDDLAVTITSQKANSKILVQMSFGQVVAHNSGSGHGLNIRLLRDISGETSNVAISQSTGTRTPKGTFMLSTANHAYDGGARYFQYLDAPSQSAGTAITYKIAGHPHGGSSNYTALFNYNANASNSGADGHQGASVMTFIAQEISA